MIVATDVVIGLILSGLALLNVYQYGKVREQRSVNLANSERLGAMEKGIRDNDARLAEMKKPTLITMTEQQVMSLASMLQSAFEALLYPSTSLARKPN